MQLTDAQITELALAVERGDITEAEAHKLVRDVVFEAQSTAAPGASPQPTPGAGKPWRGLIQPSQLTDYGIVEAAIRARTGGNPRSHELDVQKQLVEALRTNYEGFQDVIAKAKANDQAARDEAAEQRWLATTPEGRADNERRIMAEAQGVLDAKAAAKTKADAARIILEERHGLPSTHNLTDDEVTDAVFGSQEGDEQ